MKLQLNIESIIVARKLTLAAFLIAAFAISSPSRAASVTGLVESPTNLNFDFSGTASGDFVVLDLLGLSFWQFISEAHYPATPGQFGFEFGVKHQPDGLEVFVGHNLGTPLGSPLIFAQTFAHGDGFDDYSLNVTVQDNGNGMFGAFSGSFSAVHRTATVPDAGGTALLMGFALLSLLGIRRRLQQV
jgi:hypothetical protein